MRINACRYKNTISNRIEKRHFKIFFLYKNPTHATFHTAVPSLRWACLYSLCVAGCVCVSGLENRLALHQNAFATTLAALSSPPASFGGALTSTREREKKRQPALSLAEPARPDSLEILESLLPRERTKDISFLTRKGFLTPLVPAF